MDSSQPSQPSQLDGGAPKFDPVIKSEGQQIKVIETSEKSNDDSLDIGAGKDQKEGGMPSTINQSSIDPS